MSGKRLNDDGDGKHGEATENGGSGYLPDFL